MISFDTNLLLYSINQDCAEYYGARSFFDSLPDAPETVAICELVLIELYILLRNPAVLKNPLGSEDAVSIIQSFRKHPTWSLIDYPSAPNLMGELWEFAARPNIARRRVFDARLALTLRHHGVTEFATRNETHFTDFGFTRLWNPLVDYRE